MYTYLDDLEWTLGVRRGSCGGSVSRLGVTASKDLMIDESRSGYEEAIWFT